MNVSENKKPLIGFIAALGILIILAFLTSRTENSKYQMISDRGREGVGILILNTQNSELTACRFSSKYIYDFNFSGSECINLDVIRRVKETKEWRIKRKKIIEEESKKTPEQKEKEFKDKMDTFLKEGEAKSP